MSLTEKQKTVLRWLVEEVGWLVEEVGAGNLDEEDISFKDKAGELIVKNYKGPIRPVPPVKVTSAILDSLMENGYIVFKKIEPSGDYIQGRLTGKAKEAVKSNFAEPDRSAIRHLIPLTEVQHLDPELWKRCRISLSADGNDPKAWDKAVRTATVILEERLRKLGNTDSINPDATGEGLVNLIFAGKNPVFGGKLDDKKLKAYRDLYAGMMGVFRNPYAHRFHDPSPEDGGAIIGFIDLLLKMLDDLDRDPE